MWVVYIKVPVYLPINLGISSTQSHMIKEVCVYVCVCVPLNLGGLPKLSG